MNKLAFLLSATLIASPLNDAWAGTAIPLTVNLSEAVTVTGSPRVAVDVGGQTRYATYTSGSGTNALTFTLLPQAGDVDLDGIAVSSPIDLNGGTMKDAAGNNAALNFTPPNTSGIKVNYPSLGMDFVYDADGRYSLNGTVYNDLTSFLAASGGTFTRSSVGTYFDSTGTLQTAAANTPRFDYDPFTHAAKGILIEESRTNLLTYSALSSTSGTGWAGSNTSFLTVNNPGTLPVGTLACLRDEVNTGQSSGYVTKTLVLSPSTVYTFSVWVYVPSSVPAGKALLAAWYSNAGWQTILSQPTVERDQWVRKSLTFTTNATYTTTIVGAGISTGTPGLQTYACLAQLEQGSSATSYIPTTSAAVTRAADVLSLPLGAWYNAPSSSAFAQTLSSGVVSSKWPGIFDAYLSGTERLGGYYSTGGILSEQRTGGVTRSAVKTGSYGNVSIKTSYGFSAAGSAISLGGSAVSSSGSGAVPPSVSTFKIGKFDDYLNGTISSFKYYPARLSDTQLQLLSQ